ncbi:hypothetical protein B9Z19DRAFT_1069668 [Tuber borchii]|uniref:Uncharacterized protein n=1 Tax=Tuber borchii TaxID=42251 RepID=A0A2T6ZAN3_TUBBO|nr:hypothetical protein B9Z19DRAFT_1069668 [Tuber borchii]
MSAIPSLAGKKRGGGQTMKQEADRISWHLKEIRGLRSGNKERDGRIENLRFDLRERDEELKLLKEKYAAKEKELEDERVAAKEREKVWKEKEALLTTAVIFKAAFRKAGRRKDNRMMPGDRIQTIVGFQEEPDRFGCETPAQADELSSVWGGVMKGRNAIAHHEVTGEDVIEALNHCPDNVRPVLKRKFQYLFDTSPEDWPTADPEKKKRSFSE